jgi:formate/nitrite transporter FocA (FNT family)
MYFVYDIVLVPDTIKMLLMSKRGDIILLPKTTKLFNVMGMVFYMLGNVIGFIVFMGFIVEKIYKEKEKNK